MSAPLLEVTDLRKQFGSVVAVNDVSTTVERGDPTALIGPNGAGKTTLYNLLSGSLEATDGEIRFEGEEITSASPYERTRLGIGRSFQITNVFEGLTVRENVRAPVIARSSTRLNFFRNVDAVDGVEADTDEVLDLVELDDIADEQVDTLAYGDKRKVEIGITLATDPDVVFLDEPTAGMTPSETNQMTEFIARINDETDTTFVITEHDIDVVFQLASRIVVLAEGEIIAEGDPAEIRNDPAVRSAYLGEVIDA